MWPLRLESAWEGPSTADDALAPDPAARFAELMLPHLDAAYTLARHLVQNEQDAEDVTQDAYLRALKYFDGFRGPDARAWLLAIVRNACHTWHRRHRTESGHVEFEDELHSESVADRNPEAALLRASDQHTVRRAVNALPLEFREVIVLRELQGLSYQEIAEITAAPIGTVMSRLSRARQRLERSLGGRETSQ